MQQPTASQAPIMGTAPIFISAAPVTITTASVPTMITTITGFPTWFWEATTGIVSPQQAPAAATTMTRSM